MVNKILNWLKKLFYFKFRLLKENSMSNLSKAQNDLSFLENRINEVEKYGFYPSTDFSKSDYEALKRLKKYCLLYIKLKKLKKSQK